MRTLGLGAFGSAGKASAFDVFGLAREGVARGAWEDALGAGGRGVGVTPQAVVVVFLEFERPVAEERGGKGFEEEPGNAPLLPPAAREDWAVEDFKRSTRFPPSPLPLMVLGDMPGKMPLGPGNAG